MIVQSVSGAMSGMIAPSLGTPGDRIHRLVGVYSQNLRAISFKSAVSVASFFGLRRGQNTWPSANTGLVQWTMAPHKRGWAGYPAE